MKVKVKAHRGLTTPERKGKRKPKFRTICDIHRELYRVIEQEERFERKEEAIELLSEAFDCGLRMNDKLSSYAKKAKEYKEAVYERLR